MSLRNSWVSDLVLIGAGVVVAAGHAPCRGFVYLFIAGFSAAVNSGLLDSVYHLGQTTFPFETGDQAVDAARDNGCSDFSPRRTRPLTVRQHI